MSSDYSVDLAAGRIRFLKKDLCDKKLHYYISYSFPADPEKPNVGRAGSIGNHPDRKAVRRFLGIEEPAASKPAEGPIGDTVGTNASATDDPHVFTLVRAMRSEGMRVAIGKMGAPGNLKWLEFGEDYGYDEKTGRIELLGGLEIDKEKQEYIFVHGTPANRNVFLLHRAVEKREVEVTIEGKTLVEGRDYLVDLATGRVTVSDPRILERATKFRVSAGSFTFGN